MSHLCACCWREHGHCLGDDVLILVYVGTLDTLDVLKTILEVILIILICTIHFSRWHIWECRRSWAETNLWRTESYSSWNQAAEPTIRYDSWWTEKIRLFFDRGDTQERSRSPRAAWTGELSTYRYTLLSLLWKRSRKKQLLCCVFL